MDWISTSLPFPSRQKGLVDYMMEYINFYNRIVWEISKSQTPSSAKKNIKTVVWSSVSHHG